MHGDLSPLVACRFWNVSFNRNYLSGIRSGNYKWGAYIKTKKAGMVSCSDVQIMDAAHKSNHVCTRQTNPRRWSCKYANASKKTLLRIHQRGYLSTTLTSQIVFVVKLVGQLAHHLYNSETKTDLKEHAE